MTRAAEPQEFGAAAAAADDAGPLDALLVDAALGPVRYLLPDSSTARFAAGLLRRPRTTGRRLGHLAGELTRVGVGTSRWRPPGGTGGSLIRRGRRTRCCAVSCRVT